MTTINCFPVYKNLKDNQATGDATNSEVGKCLYLPDNFSETIRNIDMLVGIAK